MRRIYLLILLTCIGTNWGLSQPFTLDTTFRPNYAFVDDENKNHTGSIVDFYEEPDGRIMLVGGFDDIPSTNRSSWLRLHSNGNVDYSWNPLIPAVTGYFSIHKTSTSYFFGNHYGITPTDLSGNMISGYSNIPTDSAFSCGGFGYPYVFEDGSFLAGMNGCAYPHPGDVQRVIHFMRVRTDGYVDTTFLHDANDQVGWTYPYDFTRILCYGNWVSAYDGYPVNKLFRIFKDGTLDTTFQIDAGFSRMGYPIYVQEDGKIIIGRNFTLRGSDTLSLFRLHVNGLFDSTFNFQKVLNHPLWPTGSIVSACAALDQGYLFGGAFEAFDGYKRTSIVKTDKDGFVDSRYFNGPGIDSTKNTFDFPAAVNKIVPGQNDTYYVMGDFLMFDGQPVKPIIRLLGLSHTVGVEEEVEANTLKVYPNPASGEVTFAWDQISGFEEIEVRLFDLHGRLLAEQAWPPGIQEYSFSLPEYAGTTVYEVVSGELIERGKLVVW